MSMRLDLPSDLQRSFCFRTLNVPYTRIFQTWESVQRHATSGRGAIAADEVSSVARQPGLRERKKQRTRELIADTALRLFLERGFEAVTITEIAQAADVDAKTIYNYFPSKPDLVFQRLEAFEQALLDAVRTRQAGESILAAFARFVLDLQGSLLAEEKASEQLRAISQMIVASPALLAHEEQVFASFTASLAALIAEETGARADDVHPSVVRASPRLLRDQRGKRGGEAREHLLLVGEEGRAGDDHLADRTELLARLLLGEQAALQVEHEAREGREDRLAR